MKPGFELTLEVKGDIVFLQLRGPYDLPRLRHAIKEVGKCCRQANSRRVLANARDHVGEIEVLEMHEIGELIARELPRGCYVALVVSETRLPMDRFLETVAVNRGIPFRLFTDVRDAEIWLKSPAARPAPAFV